MPKRVGIDCQKILTPGGGGAGIEHYVWHLVTVLAGLSDRKLRLCLFLHPDLKDSSVANDLSGQPAVDVDFYPSEVLERKTWWPYTKYKRLTKFLADKKLDLLHGPANVTPLFYQGPTVVTVHDLIIYDHPEWFPDGVSGWFWRRQLVPQAIKKATRIIAVSRYTKRQVARHFRRRPEDIDVIYEGVTTTQTKPETSFLAANNITRPFLLYIGTIEPRKNLRRVIEAFARVRKSQPELSLVIAGKKGWKYESVFAAVKGLGLERDVIFCGYVDNDQKTALYQAAQAFLFPSLAEGFGLPVLDAMQSGVPVLTSNNTSLVEVAGEAALKVNPHSVTEIAQAMQKISSDKSLRKQLVAKGEVQAQQFSWQNAARQTLATYHKAISND